ncbi:ankyrin repeat domain-containing protein [Acinetobacter johnsonii]|uniref:ankyrin repeat domain-containing protein n=1 Tax=Acinetobacter johnsonii TaxID=40214 RepID=UPI00244A7A7A|nr:ankyrin repeat domain-containing protein [Acinetobacter johnsonii]MDH1489256.1 ankyrin repeat domain-containing protein [Acinetobacter johnsonii]MDH1615188.1 ankyrin repeat domain-containing protein [Acinetobacter johnsonii]
MNATPMQRQQTEYSLYRHSGGQFNLDEAWQNIHTPHGRQLFKEVYELMQPKISELELRKIIDILLKAGADVNQTAKRPILGYTPLMLAVESNEYEIARYMLDHCHGDLNKTYVDPRDGRLISCQNIISEYEAEKCKALLS